MPELPEVEVVRRQLCQILPAGTRLKSYLFRRPDLRFPLPARRNMDRFVGKPLRSIQRRSKYLLFEMDPVGAALLSHLGMSGRWRSGACGEEVRKHDHLELSWSNGVKLIYEDPRRFGVFDCVERDYEHPLLKSLGVDALEIGNSSPDPRSPFLKSTAPIKSVLLNQKFIAGLGNIYVNEILFRARISPWRKAQAISKMEWQRIFKNTLPVLQAAIERGGSTLKDYRNVNEGSGSFQTTFQVYDREDKDCYVCGHKVRQEFLSGRSTFWCSRCQK